MMHFQVYKDATRRSEIMETKTAAQVILCYYWFGACND